MGRRTQGAKFRWKNGQWHVRFTLNGERTETGTGVRDQRASAEAEREGLKIYAAAIRGERTVKRRAATAGGELSEWLSGWVESSTSLRPNTRELMERYAVYWLREWSTLAQMTDRAVADYTRERLRSVQSKTVRNELSALRKFFEWAVEVGALSESPAVPTVKSSVSGKRWPQRRRTRAPELSPAEVDAIIDALPEHSNREGWPIRARAIVAYETTLRPETLHKLEAPTNYSKGASTIVILDEHDKELYGREVPLSTKARKALDSVCPKEGPIFGRHRLDPYIQAAAKEALPPQKAAVFAMQHFRSAAITHLLERTANLAGVQYLAGHKHASTTSRYVRPSFRAALEVLKTAGKK
jgi:site-specific recombinase XerD